MIGKINTIMLHSIIKLFHCNSMNKQNIRINYLPIRLYADEYSNDEPLLILLSFYIKSHDHLICKFEYIIDMKFNTIPSTKTN